MPAVQKVSEERGFRVPDPMPEPSVVEAYDVVRGG
jgi:hypothetical protein